VDPMIGESAASLPRRADEVVAGLLRGGATPAAASLAAEGEINLAGHRCDTSRAQPGSIERRTTAMADDLLRAGYDPGAVEPRWYPIWVEEGLFEAEDTSDRPPFCIVIPPPNVTGVLHMGHALTNSIQDALVRWKRMAGHNALWLPGTDHAGIATQMVVERHLEESEGVSRRDLGREEFIRRVWDWKAQRGGRINEQTKVLGGSLDWRRERFTLDAGLSRAVREVFVRLHEEGLIYRDQRLINWCPRCATALSDLEVDHDEDVAGHLWDFAYPLADGGEVVVSTTRPETMLGDTAVAVHPDDERYRHLLGKRIRHPFVERELDIVGDAELVDPEFGTGAVKVTPAHDFNDFEVGLRHGLEMVPIFDEQARVLEGFGPFTGMDRFEARQAVLDALEERGLNRGLRDHTLSIGGCQRCSTPVEPALSTQWFVRTEPLAGPAMEAVRDGRTTIIPEQHVKVYNHWLENIRDWCISRQLWWGHRIPAWHCDECGEITVAREDPDACAACGSAALRQDPDVLDTWFSSALWPFSTLGWPDDTETLKTFYPTDVMETGYDILFFWVARMMMMGLHFMGDVPFRTVLLHGMIRDAKGHKMSKTRRNVIDPLEVTAKYGADALRFALVAQAGQGRDIKLSLDTVAGYRHFCNKVWNALRFALPHLEAAAEAGEEAGPGERSLADRWIASRCERAVAEVDRGLAEFRLPDAAGAIYQFFWHELCDWYIEMAKTPLYGDDGPARRSARATLGQVLSAAVRALHPLMPFLTEEVYGRLPGQPTARCVVAPWPEPQGWDDAEAEATMEVVMAVTTAVRNVRSETGVPPSARAVAHVRGDVDVRAVLDAHGGLVCDLARLERLELLAEDAPPPAGAARSVAEGGAEVFLPLAGLVDVAAERERLARALTKADKEHARSEGKLKNPRFVERAPAEVVERERRLLGEVADRRAKLQAALEALQAVDA